MHALDMLEYGHALVLKSIADLEEYEASIPGVCGVWSVKDILSHLTSYEAIFLEVLTSLTDDEAKTPTLDRWIANVEQFNADETNTRKHSTLSGVISEYTDRYNVAVDQLIHTPESKLKESGVLSWYGPDYDVEDFVVYSFYAHKREHCAQIAVYRDLLTRMNLAQMQAA